jgi:hypothetical protein
MAKSPDVGTEDVYDSLPGTIDDIIDRTGYSSSTVRVHLNKLRLDGRLRDEIIPDKLGQLRQKFYKKVVIDYKPFEPLNALFGRY